MARYKFPRNQQYLGGSDFSFYTAANIEEQIKDFIHRQGKKPEMITVNSYCNTLHYLSLSDSLPGDTIRQIFRVAVDILSLDNYNAFWRVPERAAG